MRGAALATAEAIAAQARQLKMPGLAKGFVALARQAREEKWSVEDYLHEVLAVEIASRVESAIRQRIHNARFPEMKTLDQFDFAASDGIDQAAILALARGEWLERGDNVVLVGPIGTGKTHLAIALGIEAARHRTRHNRECPYRARCRRAGDHPSHGGRRTAGFELQVVGFDHIEHREDRRHGGAVPDRLADGREACVVPPTPFVTEPLEDG